MRICSRLLIIFDINLKSLTIDKIDISCTYSPESLIAFIEAASLGSFSAAACKLGKSQSTVSTAIAHLEIDLGLTLFDREKRYPVLTPQGRQVLAHAQQILAANEGLHKLSIGLTDQVESTLTFVLSDIYQPTHHETLLNHFAGRYPFIEFESLIAEEDVMDLIKKGRAHIGMVEVQHYYSPDIGVARLPQRDGHGTVYSGRVPFSPDFSCTIYRAIC